VPANVQGDYNGNAVVDAADYVVWRNTQGSNDPTADGNHDGVVDISDFEIWRANFGMSTGGSSATAVPEPTTAAHLLAGIALFPFIRGWQHPRSN
jgi:hypothetical protein